MIALVLQSNIIPFPACDAPTQQGKSNEWYTPAYIIEAARKVLGTIDLDPASCETANQVVRATRFYTAQDNGLEQAWYGNVWLNPPYSSPNGSIGRIGGNPKGTLKPFILKLIEEYRNGNVSQAIILVNSDTDASWFIPLWAYLICFCEHPVKFKRPNQIPQTQFFGTAFAYLGTNDAAFISEFSKFGHIAKSIAGPRRDMVQASLWQGRQP